ncbi:MAG: hypothetical protein VKJ86_05925 [Synechococcus sp.]|nr:hypothetical protein [Synechococcus sp.]
MTTERELQEWPQKIRRVRGQAPLRKSQGQQKASPLMLVLLFLCSLAIASAFRHYQQQQAQSDQPSNSFPTNQL